MKSWDPTSVSPAKASPSLACDGCQGKGGPGKDTTATPGSDDRLQTLVCDVRDCSNVVGAITKEETLDAFNDSKIRNTKRTPRTP